MLLTIDGKRISLIYSISKDDIGNRNIEKLLYQEFQKQGIEVMFVSFILIVANMMRKSG